jgi:hypothetical protein
MRKQSEPFLLPSSEPVVSDLGNSPSASDRHLERSGLAQSCAYPLIFLLCLNEAFL